ncbi:MAG: manganese-binding transcriptional regulator MntR [Allgaiera sp.]|jgi:DtxR family manganese transport transcriptional regulator|nr:manganese-binding transcriptional regulator MntR [Allgaiera sp.]
MTEDDRQASEASPSEQAGRFARAREAQANAVLEDYVEMIGDLIAVHGEARVADIAERMGVAHPTATKAVARLKREGLATSRPYRGVFLTDEGAALADRVRARHRTVVDLLVAVGVPAEHAEADAEGIEHHVSRRTLKAFELYLATNRPTRRLGLPPFRVPRGEVGG